MPKDPMAAYDKSVIQEVLEIYKVVIGDGNKCRDTPKITNNNVGTGYTVLESGKAYGVTNNDSNYLDIEAGNLKVTNNYMNEALIVIAY